MSLAALLDELVALLPDGVTSNIGSEEAVSRAGSPPRVIFDYVGESIESPHGQGNGLPRSRWLVTRACDVDLHIWGATLAATEGLVEMAINLIHERTPGDGHRWRGGRWVGNAISQRGVVYLLGVTFLLPVERRETFLHMPEMPITGEFVEPA